MKQQSTACQRADTPGLKYWQQAAFSNPVGRFSRGAGRDLAQVINHLLLVSGIPPFAAGFLSPVFSMPKCESCDLDAAPYTCRGESRSSRRRGVRRRRHTEGDAEAAAVLESSANSEGPTSSCLCFHCGSFPQLIIPRKKSLYLEKTAYLAQCLWPPAQNWAFVLLFTFGRSQRN